MKILWLILPTSYYTKTTEKTQSAIERQLAIIGEALNKLKKFEPELSIENDKQIIGFRNRLVHAYDSIDNAIVWVIVKKYLSGLKFENRNLIKIEDQPTKNIALAGSSYLNFNLKN